jgi:hypothetical protein
MQPEQRHTATGSAIDVGAVEPTLPEVRQLWWFLDGAIMILDVRKHLRNSWGFCPRHTWLYGAVEIQLRGGDPFSTSILWEDLTRRAAQAVRNRTLPWNLSLSRLKAGETCYTCDHLALGDREDSIFQEYHQRARRLDRARRRFEESREHWTARSCPLCLGGDGLICRQHLLLGAEPTHRLADQLWQLADRLDALRASLTWHGKPVGPQEQASWIEALGWFAGWDYPPKLLAPGGGHDRSGVQAGPPRATRTAG